MQVVAAEFGAGRARPEAEDLLRFQTPFDVQASPAGDRVAFVVKRALETGDGYETRIWLAGRDGGDARPVTAGPRDSCPRWSPDGRWLAFLSARGDEPKVYLLPMVGGEALPASRGLKGAASLAWSSDGAWIAVLAYGEHPAADESLRQAAAWLPEGAERAPAVHVSERLEYRFDGMGYHDDRRFHLFALRVPEDPAAGPGEARQVTSGPYDVVAFAWRPGTRRLTFAANRDDDAELGWRKDLWEVEVGPDGAPAGEPVRIARHTGPIWSLAWSPDGRRLAFIGSDGRHQHATKSSLFQYRDGQGVADALPDYFWGVGDAALGDVGQVGMPATAWTRDGRAVAFTSFRDGRLRLVLCAFGEAGEGLAPERAVELAAEGLPSPAWLAPAADGIYFVGEDWDEPPEVWYLPFASRFAPAADGSSPSPAAGSPRPLTALNREAALGLPALTTRRLRWTSEDGWEIEGWLRLPEGAAASPGLPLVVEIHGGPHGNYAPAYRFADRLHAGRGRAVFFCNPRGSSGYGQAFQAACVRDWGGMDFRDILAGVERAVEEGSVDARRMAVTGVSYGGYMTGWVVTHTDRFACAVAEMVVANLVSMYGTSDVGPHFIPFEGGGTPWEGLEELWAHSPLKYARACRTPTLVITGTADHRCPSAEGEQLYVALKRQGVPAAIAVFEEASHAFSLLGLPSQRVRRLRLVDAWMQRWLGEACDEAASGREG